MQYRKIKGTSFSVIGLGCYALSGAYGPKDEKKIQQVLRRGYEQGVNFFDTAEGYGNAEMILGKTLKPFREQVMIATKVGIRQGVKANLSASYLQEACEESLKRLDTDYIDLYQVHFDDPHTPVTETLTALEALKSSGKIRFYGVGHLPFDRVKAYLEGGKPSTIMMELSAAADDSRSTLLPLCRQYGVGALAFSVTGRGVLTGSIDENTVFPVNDLRNIDPLFQRERLQFALRVEQKLRQIGNRYGYTSVQVAIAWVLAQPGVVSALTGPSTLQHLEENLAAADWRFPEEELSCFESWLQEEKITLTTAQHLSVERILEKPLDTDPSVAFTDLIYAVETAVNANWTNEQSILPLFQELFPLHKKRGIEAIREMQPIQRQLANIILPGMHKNEGKYLPGL